MDNVQDPSFHKDAQSKSYIYSKYKNLDFNFERMGKVNETKDGVNVVR